MKTKIIHGQTFELSQPYSAGHTLTEAEAKTLNQVRSENIGNNLREQVKKLIDEASDIAAATALVADYDSKYSFAMGSTREARVVDPIEKEALKIAKEQVKAHLAKQGRKLSDIPEGKTAEEWKETLDAKYEEVAAMQPVLDAAKKAVAARKKQADALADAINLDA